MALSLTLTLISCATGGRVGGAAPAPAPSPSSTTKIYRLKIGRVASAQLTNAEADRILAGATQVLRNRDSGSDVSANIVLQRSGDVRVIPGPAVISSAEDYAAIGRSGVQVAIVEAVQFCTATKAGILGCSHIGGSFMALVRRGSLEDIIWAHEFGHNCGLNHRNDPSALMNPEAGANRRSLDLAEARTYETRHAASGTAAIMAPDAPAPADAEEFLNRVYIHGIPYAHVSRFGPMDTEKFKAILGNPLHKAQWTNAAVALGAIGTADAVEKVHRFVREGRGRLDHDSYHAKLNALLGLGYAAAHRGSPQALDHLEKNCSLENWKSQLHWSAPGRQMGEETARALTAASYSGLALSGKSEADPILAREADADRPDSPLREHAKTALKQLRERVRQKSAPPQ